MYLYTRAYLVLTYIFRSDFTGSTSSPSSRGTIISIASQAFDTGSILSDMAKEFEEQKLANRFTFVL